MFNYLILTEPRVKRVVLVYNEYGAGTNVSAPFFYGLLFKFDRQNFLSGDRERYKSVVVHGQVFLILFLERHELDARPAFAAVSRQLELGSLPLERGLRRVDRSDSAAERQGVLHRLVGRVEQTHHIPRAVFAALDRADAQIFVTQFEERIGEGVLAVIARRDLRSGQTKIELLGRLPYAAFFPVALVRHEGVAERVFAQTL